MGLLNKTDSKFEAEGDGGAATAPADNKTGAATAHAKTTAAPAVAGNETAATKTAVATKEVSALSTSVAASMRVMESFKDALQVDYNTLTQIIANQGNFIDRETKTVLGDTIIFELLSYQASFVVSPEDDEAPDDMVRYSKDGVTCTDGTVVQEHLEFLHKNNFPKARLKERAVVVGAIETAAKTQEYNGTLVQFDLSPASRTLWLRYMANAAYGLKIGKHTAESVKRIKATANLATRGNDSFTQASFVVA